MKALASMRSLPAALAASAILVLTTGACLEDTDPASDVTGNYTITYDNQMKVTLYIGEGVYEAMLDGESGILSFDTAEVGMLEIDIGDFCALEEVQCPSETMWSDVAIDQPFANRPNPNSHIVNVINNSEPPSPGELAGVIGGLIDAEDEFVLALGLGLAGNGTNCGLLALSWATGHFTKDLAGSIDGIEDGIVGVGFLGACVWPGLAVGASLVLETGYTAARTGEFDPPPYVEVDPDDTEPGLPEETM